ncbi:MAG: 50S ribosomal protein L10 [Oligoflexia bacterium]|nr:50S ribosomal protein L10 [Oligoflexia bacterium]
MDRATKQAEVTNLSEKFQRSIALFVADYKGMNVEQVTTVRKELSNLEDVEMKVVKNTLALRALQTQPYHSALEDTLTGTNAIIFAYKDPSGPAKSLVKFAEEFEHLRIKSGVLKGKRMDEGMIKTLATLPSREQLVAKLMGSLNAPASNLVGVLAAVPRSVLNVLNAVKAKKEASA